MIYTHVAAALLSAAIAAVSAWAVQSWRMDAQVQSGKTALESLKREHAESLTRASGSALNATIAWQKVKDDAIDRAQQRAKAQAHSADIARRERDSLRQQLSDAEQRLADASPAALIEYARSLNHVFGQCSQRYAELAIRADGHAADAATCRAAWPVNRVQE